jgi:hypothetical protein
MMAFKRSARHRAATVALVSAVSLYARDGHAGSFSPEGVFSFEPNAALTQSFESVPSPTVGLSRGIDAPLEGEGYVVVKSEQSLARVTMVLPPVQASYRARAFVRKNRLYASIRVQYADGRPVEATQLFPTGRITSDGWYEIASARFVIDGTKKPSTELTMFGSGADLDAFEVVPEGTYKALSVCKGKIDARCNAAGGEYCSAGYCRNGNAQVPALPEGEERAKAIKYFSDRLQYFFGGRITRQDTLPLALRRLATLKDASSGFQFWNGFATALHELRDWHTKTDGPVGTEGRGALPICVVEGDADLSRDAAPSTAGLPDVIISHVGPEGNSGFKAGDRIVAVNGIHPVTFAESLYDIDWSFWHSNDPDGHAEALERMRYLIRRWGETITVIRCDPASVTCSAPETIEVASLPAIEPALYPECDHRPSYVVDGPDPVTHSVRDIYVGPLKNVAPEEQLYGMVWDSVFLDGSGTNPYKAPYDLLRDKAKGVLLDHRTGNGGTEPAAEYLTSLFKTPELLGVATGFHFTTDFLDQFPVSKGLQFFEARKTGREAYNVGSPSARTDLKAALLLARDGSASDWFPEGMKGSLNIRSFGRRTAGAFSSFIQFDYFGGINFQIASGDYVRSNGTTHIGEGVLPDEEVLPKQSDLLVGRDTAVLRALEWLRQ